jgi:hypothetical protein
MAGASMIAAVVAIVGFALLRIIQARQGSKNFLRGRLRGHWSVRIAQTTCFDRWGQILTIDVGVGNLLQIPTSKAYLQ